GGAVNAISQPHRQWIGAGGLGLLIGDGKLNYSTERILETYYLLPLCAPVFLTLDYQFIDNPGYNSDRGPVSAFAARLHAQY
ncbi:MAG TPA: carbohydrate porin, partial [Hyphomicrobium sp.]|nr:carbohydrate porin [Hyphomicrobium sp.]